MSRIAVADVWEATGGLLIAADGLAEHGFGRATIDSREVQQDALFFALRGEREDGPDFAAEAITAGALGALIEGPVDVSKRASRFHVSDSLAALQRLAGWWRKRHELKDIDVPGSVGTTHTKRLSASVF